MQPQTLRWRGRTWFKLSIEHLFHSDRRKGAFANGANRSHDATHHVSEKTICDQFNANEMHGSSRFLDLALLLLI